MHCSEITTKGGEWRSNYFCFLKNHSGLEGALNYFSKESNNKKCRSFRLFSSRHLKMYTTLGAWTRSFAILDTLKRNGGLRWQHWRWEAIAMDSHIYPVHKPKNWHLKTLLAFRKSTSNITISGIALQNVRNAWMHECVRGRGCTNVCVGEDARLQCNVLCFVCHCALLAFDAHLHTCYANSQCTVCVCRCTRVTVDLICMAVLLLATVICWTLRTGTRSVHCAFLISSVHVGPGCRVLRNQDYKNPRYLLGKMNVILEIRVTLAYTINPFGPSALHVSLYNYREAENLYPTLSSCCVP